MKICIFSDSHGYAKNMIEAVRREKPALCFFLGDGEGDLAALRALYPDLPLYAVRGNCDLRSTLPLVLKCAIGGLRFFAVHGHQFEVKYDDSLQELCHAALRADTDILLFGHTHLPYLDQHFGMNIMNPGTIGKVKMPSYGIISIEDGKAHAEIRYLDQNKV